MENNSSPLVVIQKVEYNTHNHVDTAEIIHYLKTIFKEVDMAEERLTAILNLIGSEEERQQIKDKLIKAKNDIESTV